MSAINPTGTFSSNPLSWDITGGLGVAVFWYLGAMMPSTWPLTVIPTVSAAIAYRIAMDLTARRYPRFLGGRAAAIVTGMFVGAMCSIFVWEVLGFVYAGFSMPDSIYLILSIVVPAGIIVGGILGYFVTHTSRA